MPFTTFSRTAGLAAAVAASATLVACGGSTSTTASHQQPASPQVASNGSGPSTQPVPAAQGVPAPLVACLHKQGISHLVYTRGAPLKAPAGVSVQTFRHALLKCGVPARVGGYVPPAPGAPTKRSGHGKRQFHTGSFAGPHLVAALDKFALCMRRHGINLPEPNVGGSGPIFRGASVNPSSRKFGAAEHTCFPLIRASLPKPGEVKPRFNPGGKTSTSTGEGG